MSSVPSNFSSKALYFKKLQSNLSIPHTESTTLSWRCSSRSPTTLIFVMSLLPSELSCSGDPLYISCTDLAAVVATSAILSAALLAASAALLAASLAASLAAEAAEVSCTPASLAAEVSGSAASLAAAAAAEAAEASCTPASLAAEVSGSAASLAAAAAAAALSEILL